MLSSLEGDFTKMPSTPPWWEAFTLLNFESRVSVQVLRVESGREGQIGKLGVGTKEVGFFLENDEVD